MKISIRSQIIVLVIILFASCYVNAQYLTKFQKWEQPSYFRGFNVGLWCAESDCEKTQDDIIDLKNTGANLVQINVYGAGFRYPEYPYEINYEGIEWITRLVNFCRNAEIYYIIAVRSGPGRFDVSDEMNSPIWEDESYTQVEMYGKMLKEIAKAFLPDSLFVGLNLTVEPDPFSEEYLSPSDLKQTLINNDVNLYEIYRSWIDSVRSYAPLLPLIVQSAQYSSPEYWGETEFIHKQVDPYIVYDFHTYEPFEAFTHHEEIDGATYPVVAWNETIQDDVVWDSTFYTEVLFEKVKIFQETYDVPILMGEMGMLYPQNNGEEYLNDIYDIAINNKWHFALWSWRSDGNKGKVYFNYERFDEVSLGSNYWNTVKSFFIDVSTDLEDVKGSGIPKSFRLIQNYPNPFNPSTVIGYQLPFRSYVTIMLYDLLGKEIRKIVEAEHAAGNYKLNFHCRDLASGIYYYQIRAVSNTTQFTDTKKFIILK